MKRLYNHCMGLTAANDRLPGHLLEPLQEGGSVGYVPPFEEMKAAYYAARGWDPATGRPTRGALAALGLQRFADELWESEGSR